jgi:uncharacterized membrane protein YfhO
MRVRVAVERPTWLLAREPYYAGWRATVDGRATAIHPAAGFLLAVLVDRGTHEVELRYREPGLWIGALLAAMAAVALPLVLRRVVGPPTAAAPRAA